MRTYAFIMSIVIYLIFTVVIVKSTESLNTFLVLFSFISLICGFNIYRYTKFMRFDYKRFVKQHPDHVHNGQVSCTSCNSRRIHTKALMNQSYTREHFCSQCGEFLFYSPER